jgi:hypothetical protein
MWGLDQPIEPDPVLEAYKRDVDRTLLRENLRRSIEERLEALMRLQEFAEELQRAGQRLRRCRTSKLSPSSRRCSKSASAKSPDPC